jgi:hypothetical protein
MLRIGALVKAGMDPFPVSDDFTLLVRQAPIIQLLMTANSLGITYPSPLELALGVGYIYN